MKAEADRADQAGMADTRRNRVDAVARAEADVATRTRTKAEVATTSLMEAVVERGPVNLDRIVLTVRRRQPPAEITAVALELAHGLGVARREAEDCAQDLIGAIQSLKGDEEVVLQVERDGQLSFVTVDLTK